MSIANAHRATSYNAYLRAESEGKISDMKQQVLHLLSKNPPMTGREVDEKLGGLLGGGAWKRLSELRDAGFIAEVGKRKCTVTGFTSIVWTTKDKVPSGYEFNRQEKIMKPPKLFNIIKNRKLLNATECSASRCKEPPQDNCPGVLWNDPHNVALCAKHLALALQYSEYMATQPQQANLAVVPAAEIEGVQVPTTWLDRAKEVITWIQSLQQEAEAVAEAAQGHVIENQAEMEAVSEQLRKTKGVRNQIKQYEDEVTTPLKQVLRRIAELTAPTKKAMERAEGLLRGILSAAAVAEARRNQELAAQAAQAHAAGQDATAATGQMTTSTDLDGVSVRIVWTPVVQDVMQLPEEYVERRPNLQKLKEYAASFEGREPTPIPGVSWVQDAPLRVRGA